jgi:hypothetical protein
MREIRIKHDFGPANFCRNQTTPVAVLLNGTFEHRKSRALGTGVFIPQDRRETGVQFSI